VSGSSSGSGVGGVDWTQTPFRELKLIGRGGMGVVYSGVDARVGRRVALKLQLQGSPESRARFQREGQLAAALQHPNVVQVHGIHQLPQGDLLVCELVEDARSLDEAWKGLERYERVRLLRDAAAGVAAAHAAGIVHRDLKPENVLVGGEGRARVADFGVAYSGDLERLTQTGAMVGTPSFMAPEQLTGAKNPSAACDVWALGVLLFLALTDELPFAGDSIFHLAATIASGASGEHARLLADSPTPLRDLVFACLRTELGERLGDASQVRDALQAWLDDPVQGSGRGGAWPWALGGVAAALGLGLAGLYAFAHEPAPLPALETPAPSQANPSPSTSEAEVLAARIDDPVELVAALGARRLLRRFPDHPRAEEAARFLRRRLWRPLLTLKSPEGTPLGCLLLDPSPRIVMTSPTGKHRRWRPGREVELHQLPNAQGMEVTLDQVGRVFYCTPRYAFRDPAFAKSQDPGGVLRVDEDANHAWIVERARKITAVTELGPGRFAIGGKRFLEIVTKSETLARLDLPRELVHSFVPFRDGLISISLSEGEDNPTCRIRWLNLALEPQREVIELAGHNARVVPTRDESRLLIANFHYSRLEVLDVDADRRHVVFTPTGIWGAGSMTNVAWTEDERQALVLIGAKSEGARMACWDTTQTGKRVWGRELPRSWNGTFAGPGPDFLVIGLKDTLQVMAISSEKP
jgi:serine/threonine protein kinase